MQSYGEFGLIPRKCAKSSSTCVDNGSNFGQIGETGQKSCPKGYEKGPPLRAHHCLTLNLDTTKTVGVVTTQNKLSDIVEQFRCRGLLHLDISEELFAGILQAGPKEIDHIVLPSFRTVKYSLTVENSSNSPSSKIFLI